ncbi:hypothetical protein [Amycolatopsis sp. CA-230715]|uniref:hypothetical protein n=1 Tax=Amycolatopsis sp. CA-230715 TaxID=2745196 RepID=UPI001C00CD94|nr:hypothetical protein [Amycolatopsis sp. CA-230715]QWF78741.1 hypothetical protein HUW46_02139 [Amycolatopsis sp. CA-230715]
MDAELELTEDDVRCPSCSSVHFLGVEIFGVYDGVLYWECGGCGHRWHRFPAGHHLHGRAVPYLAEPEPMPARHGAAC